MSDTDEAAPLPERAGTVPRPPRPSVAASRARLSRMARYVGPGVALTLTAAGATWGSSTGAEREMRVESHDAIRGSSAVPSGPESIAEIRASVARALAPRSTSTEPATEPEPTRRAPPSAPSSRRPAPEAPTPIAPSPSQRAPLSVTSSAPRDRELDDLLATLRAEPTYVPPPSETASLAAVPSRADVTRVMASLRESVLACGDGSRGVADVYVTAHGETTLVDAVVRGRFAGTPVGACIERAVRAAVFPRFRNRTFSFGYPFRF